MTRPRVLFVDDEPALLEAIARNFRNVYDVVTATSGAAALAMVAADSTIAVVISDFCMPAMTGKVLLARVGEHAPTLPCVLLTGSELEQPADLPPNVFRFVAKPCSRAALRIVIDEAIAAAAGTLDSHT